MKELGIFKEIEIGGRTKEQLLRQLLATGTRFNHYAEILFGHASFAPSLESEKVKLVKAKQSDLGLSHASTFAEIVAKASDAGLSVCPLYLGAFLRLEYIDQPEGPYLTIVSVQPAKDADHPNGFYLRNSDHTLWLRGYRASDDYEWPLDHDFILLKH